MGRVADAKDTSVLASAKLSDSVLLVFAPWPIRNALALGAFIPLRSTIGLELWMGNRSGNTGFLDESVFPIFNRWEYDQYVAKGEVAYMRDKSALARAYIRAHPDAFFRLSGIRFIRFWTGNGSRNGSVIFILHAVLTTALGTLGWLASVAKTPPQPGSLVPAAADTFSLALLHYARGVPLPAGGGSFAYDPGCAWGLRLDQLPRERKSQKAMYFAGVTTTYIRFFHVETHHLPLLLIEASVTLATLIVFTIAPACRHDMVLNGAFRSFSLRRRRACMTVLLLSFFGRIALLPIEPFPPPRVQDEFSYLLAAETFAHGRLTNPTPPQWHHFEAFHVLMQPTYMSKYGAAAPLFMAFGERFFSTPRVGVLLSMALAAASLCWMLQVYLPAEWAFLGGLLAVVRISWFSYFGNGYWGGSVAMLGGCMLLGAAARLARRPKPSYALLMALALILLANSRPFEGALLALPLASMPGGPCLRNERLFASCSRGSRFYWWERCQPATTVTRLPGGWYFPG